MNPSVSQASPARLAVLGLFLAALLGCAAQLGPVEEPITALIPAPAPEDVSLQPTHAPEPQSDSSPDLAPDSTPLFAPEAAPALAPSQPEAVSREVIIIATPVPVLRTPNGDSVQTFRAVIVIQGIGLLYPMTQVTRQGFADAVADSLGLATGSVRVVDVKILSSARRRLQEVQADPSLFQSQPRTRTVAVALDIDVTQGQADATSAQLHTVTEDGTLQVSAANQKLPSSWTFSTQANDEDFAMGKGPSTGAIVGIVLGLAAFVALIVGVVWMVGHHVNNVRH